VNANTQTQADNHTENRYVVEVKPYPQEERDTITAALAEQFNISVEQASQLLARLPGVATKPMSQEHAKLAGKRFRDAGLAAVVRVAVSSTAETQAAQPANRPEKAVKQAGKEGSRGRRQVSLRTKFLLSVLFPVLLTLLGALAVISFNVAPTLREQLLATARAPALSTVERIESLLPSTELANERLDTAESLPVLQETTEGLRRAFRDQSITFIAVTDGNGRYQAGWFNRLEREALSSIRSNLNQAIAEQGRQAVALASQFGGDIPESENTSGVLQAPDIGQLEIISQPIRRSGQTLGAVVVGVNTSLVIARVRTILRNTILVTLLPIILAILIALLIGRNLTRNVIALTEAADRLSRGDLDTTVDVRSNDELGDLSDSFERLRISLRLAMNRLRRKSRQSN
jgi:HAMP domain-containing protein